MTVNFAYLYQRFRISYCVVLEELVKLVELSQTCKSFDEYFINKVLYWNVILDEGSNVLVDDSHNKTVMRLIHWLAFRHG